MSFLLDIKEAVAVLNNGGTILYPTDTVWGLGCDATDEKAVAKIYGIKKRNEEKSMIILLADARDILQYVAAPPPDIIAMVEAFEKPTTVIYNNALGFPANVVNKDGSIAIRVTTDPFCKALIKRFRKPIVSTSANISGEPTPAIYAEVAPTIIAGVDYVVDYRSGDSTITPPSRLISMDDEGNVIVLRD